MGAYLDTDFTLAEKGTSLFGVSDSVVPLIQMMELKLKTRLISGLIITNFMVILNTTGTTMKV